MCNILYFTQMTILCKRSHISSTQSRLVHLVLVSISQSLALFIQFSLKDGTPRTRGMLVRRFTGDGTPYSFPVKPIRLIKPWPDEPPFKPEDFFRTDGNSDNMFYTVPRLVYHIDEPAVCALTQYYRKAIPANSDVLDIASSWVS
jgi:hypothetical protein